MLAARQLQLDVGCWMLDVQMFRGRVLCVALSLSLVGGKAIAPVRESPTCIGLAAE